MSEYFVDDSADYLTMARIMHKKWFEWSAKNLHKDDIGHTIIRAKSAYEAGFMAGFEGRYFEQND